MLPRIFEAIMLLNYEYKRRKNHECIYDGGKIDIKSGYADCESMNQARYHRITHECLDITEKCCAPYISQSQVISCFCLCLSECSSPRPSIGGNTYYSLARSFREIYKEYSYNILNISSTFAHSVTILSVSIPVHIFYYTNQTFCQYLALTGRYNNVITSRSLKHTYFFVNCIYNLYIWLVKLYIKLKIWESERVQKYERRKEFEEFIEFVACNSVIREYRELENKE